uniref:Uncharacterized protein n=1 Tax=viral metagenome TaxID=1070528 RepID=A0A6C0DQS5_9ZZZZ
MIKYSCKNITIIFGELFVYQSVSKQCEEEAQCVALAS